MARLRWALVLLALGIGLPALLIIQRATASLELENAYRHQTVAERVFDEMERSLSDFLLREEARPAADFDTLRAMDPLDASLPASFAEADEPFLLGWFVRSTEAATASSWPSRTADRARVEQAVRAALAAPVPVPVPVPTESPALANAETTLKARAKAESPRAQPRRPAPGVTRSIGDAAALAEADGLPGEDESAAPAPYAVLQNLNRASSLRSERQSKALEKRAGATGRDLERATAREALAEAPADSGRSLDAVSQPAGRRRDSADSLGSASADSAVASEEAFADDRIPAPAAARARATRPALASVDPFVGRTTSTGEIVLTRTAWRGSRFERQGLVLDRARLIEALGGSLLEATGLASHARLDFTSESLGSDSIGSEPSWAAPSASTPAVYRYVHRFAEPFDGLVARLELDPLPGLETARSIYTLAGLLAIALVIGLFAVDRMTRVVVEYAQRRSDFVAAVSHELRTPLTAIRMYAEMLRDGLVASESQRSEYYATITDESERLSRLIDNVLEFSRLEQNRRRVDLIAGPLAETVREAASKLSAHAAREGFELTLDLPDALPRVRYDRDAVTQIVFNLVDNALKYAREAERRRVEIRLAAAARGVELRVRDFGPGIPADQLERIFEPFYRIGEELTRTSEGTGIGLALVRELALGMGGSARALRPEGGGLEIVVTLAADA